MQSTQDLIEFKGMDSGSAEHARMSAHIIDRYTPRLTGYLRKRVKNRTDAEDILNMILDQIIRSVGQFNRKKGRSFSWVSGIARRKIADFFRSPANRPVGEFIDYSGFDPADAADELEVIMVRDRWDTAEEAVRAVTNPDHWVCYDRHVHGHESDELIGADLGLPALTCARYRNRIRQAIEAEFARLGAEEGGRP